ncbi:MAG: PorV/PorQ family protein [bacterium]
MKILNTVVRQILALFILLAIVVSTGFAQQENKKLAQTGMKFLNVGMSARQASLADAFTSVEAGSSSMFYNPSGMAKLGRLGEASFGQVNWIADIKHLYGAVALSPADGDYGVIGLSMQYVTYGEIEATVLANNKQGFLDLGTFEPNALMFGLSYARALTNKFSIGATAKMVRQDLGTGIINANYTYAPDGTTPIGLADSGKVEAENKLNVVAFDFGLMYQTGFKSLTLGMTIRNFAREVKYQKEGFQLPLTFKIGMSMNVLDLFEVDPKEQSLFVAVDAEHPRDYPEQLRIGMEYMFMKTVALRVGYVSPADEYSICYGVGVQQSLSGVNFGIDYAYTPFGVFNNVQRISLSFGF